MMARKITVTEFWELYEQDMVYDIVNIGARIYGKSVKGQADKPEGYEIIYAMG